MMSNTFFYISQFTRLNEVIAPSFLSINLPSGIDIIVLNFAHLLGNITHKNIVLLYPYAVYVTLQKRQHLPKKLVFVVLK